MVTSPKASTRGTHLHQIADELAKCSRCGECRSVCPVFDSLGWEKYAARGKVALTRAVIDGKLELTASYEEVVTNCLLCLACVENCGSGVRLDRVILAARNELAEKRGLSVSKRIAHWLLSGERELMDYLARGGSVAQYLLFKRLPNSSGLKRRFPMPMVDKDRYIPSLVHRSFRNRIPEINNARRTKQTVLFFTGCLVNYVYPQIGESVVHVLNQFDTAVIIPRTQHCCGAPAETGGDLKTTRALAQKNLDALFAFPHDIVTTCASGGYMLKKIYPGLFDRKDPYFRKALSVAGRTHDINAYLVNKIGIHEIEKKVKQIGKQKVTYHDPCHLVRGQGIAEAPRRLLQAAYGDRFVEMTDADRCCGSGGTYGLTHRNISLRILQRKTDCILATGADIVATACPGCIIQLKDGIQQRGDGANVYHVIELLYRQITCL